MACVNKSNKYAEYKFIAFSFDRKKHKKLIKWMADYRISSPYGSVSKLVRELLYKESGVKEDK